MALKKIDVVTVHGGHNPSGKIACGATGILDESKEDRIITKKVIELLKKHKIKAYDTTCNDGRNQTDVLQKICAKCNSHKDVDLNISIHFNSGAGDKKGNGKTTGSEVYLTAKANDKYDVAKRICNQLENIGFTNRGVKVRDNLYFLNRTNEQAILIEVCFVDDKDDAKLYNAHKDDVAHVIVQAILNHNKAVAEKKNTKKK